MKVYPPKGMTPEQWEKLKSGYTWDGEFPDTRRGKRELHRALLALKDRVEQVFGAMKRNKTFNKSLLSKAIRMELHSRGGQP